MRRARRAAITMPRRVASLILIILVLFLFEMYSGNGGGAKDGKDHACLDTKVNIARKSLVEVVQDYDYGRPNTRHDPKEEGQGTVARIANF